MNDSLLPVVSNEITASVAQELNPNISDKENVRKQWKKIAKENPVIAQFIAKFANKSKHRIPIAYCAIIVYNMLKTQAEVNWLEDNIKLN